MATWADLKDYIDNTYRARVAEDNGEAILLECGHYGGALPGEALEVPPNGIGHVMPCHVCPRHVEGQLVDRRVVTKVNTA